MKTTWLRECGTCALLILKSSREDEWKYDCGARGWFKRLMRHLELPCLNFISSLEIISVKYSSWMIKVKPLSCRCTLWTLKLWDLSGKHSNLTIRPKRDLYQIPRGPVASLQLRKRHSSTVCASAHQKSCFYDWLYFLKKENNFPDWTWIFFLLWSTQHCCLSPST